MLPKLNFFYTTASLDKLAYGLLKRTHKRKTLRHHDWSNLLQELTCCPQAILTVFLKFSSSASSLVSPPALLWPVFKNSILSKEVFPWFCVRDYFNNSSSVRSAIARQGSSLKTSVKIRLRMLFSFLFDRSHGLKIYISLKLSFYKCIKFYWTISSNRRQRGHPCWLLRLSSVLPEYNSKFMSHYLKKVLLKVVYDKNVYLKIIANENLYFVSTKISSEIPVVLELLSWELFIFWHFMKNFWPFPNKVHTDNFL